MALRLLSDASKDFDIIMRRLIHQGICFLFEQYLKAVVDGANLPRRFVAIAFIFFVAVAEESVSVLKYGVLGKGKCRLCNNCSSTSDSIFKRVFRLFSDDL